MSDLTYIGSGRSLAHVPKRNVKQSELEGIGRMLLGSPLYANKLSVEAWAGGPAEYAEKVLLDSGLYAEVEPKRKPAAKKQKKDGE
jgi:hypothetical protein